jgi:hypothetical protein
MSLINDALKKAARQRAEEANPSPLVPGGGTVRSAGQGGPMSMQTMVLLGAAALVLIVVSAVVTGMLLAGKFDARKPAPLAAEVRPPVPAAAAPVPAITISVPKPAPAPAVVTVPVPTAPPAPPPAAVEPTPAPVVAAAPRAEPPPAPAPAAPAAVPSSATAAATAAAAAAAQAKNDTIQSQIDKYRVSGVRASGADSKALIDGHVFKVGDFLDRSLGLKLIGVDQDHLTFTIKDGTTFTKSL